MKKISAFLFINLIAIVLTACLVGPSEEGLAEEISSNVDATKYNGPFKNGAVVTAHREATKVGVDILTKGGNAVDAAIAVQFALAVVYPTAGNLGGGGFMVLRDESGGINTLDFRETAPANSSRNMFLDEKGEAMDKSILIGGLSVGVPGSVAGLFESHRKYGSVPMHQLIQPAIDLATEGFRITEGQALRLNRYVAAFKQTNNDNDYLIPETIWNTEDLIVQTDLGKTLEKIRDYGESGFYKGEVAEKMVESIVNSGGIMTLKDLLNYTPKWREPLSSDYRDLRIHTMGPPSSGGIVLLQILKMLDQLQIDTCKFQSRNYVHFIAECERRAYADRSVHLGDPDFYQVRMNELLNDNYLNERKRSIMLNEASESKFINAGNIDLVAESEETTHISIADKNGMAVSVTTTLNSSYGSKRFVTGAGFLLNNEMDDFSIKPGRPNQYGLIGGEANAIEPGKRMLSSMTPTIIEKGNQLYMVIGSPGGSKIITSVLQVFMNVYIHEMGMQLAVDQGRFHHQWLPDTLYFEKGKFDDALLTSLMSIGHVTKEGNSMGRVNAILKSQNLLECGADQRRDCVAAGY